MATRNDTIFTIELGHHEAARIMPLRRRAELDQMLDGWNSEQGKVSRRFVALLLKGQFHAKAVEVND